MTASPEIFSATVTEADAKFRRACRMHQLKYESYTHPRTGPDGEPLIVGVCRAGAQDATHLLLIISGTHGVEGYAGAGIQTGWLLHHQQDNLPPNTGIVMVHMLNPWGMAWNRRETDNNVDLFRNLIYSEFPSDADPLYDIVDDMLNLEHWDTRDPVAWQKQAEPLIAEHGADRLVAAIRRGQHHRPKSMTFHGNGPCWSKSTLEQIVDDYLMGASHVAVIDIHTGFGEYGQGLVMSYDPPGSDRHNRVSSWFSGEIYTPGSDSDIPDHRIRLPYQWIEARLADTQVTAEILEFGTFDPTEIGEIFNANHHYHVYGNPLCEQGLKWGRRYRRYCYPGLDDWKSSVWSRGRRVIDKTLVGLSEWGQ